MAERTEITEDSINTDHTRKFVGKVDIETLENSEGQKIPALRGRTGMATLYLLDDCPEKTFPHPVTWVVVWSEEDILVFTHPWWPMSGVGMFDLPINPHAMLSRREPRPQDVEMRWKLSNAVDATLRTAILVAASMIATLILAVRHFSDTPTVLVFALLCFFVVRRVTLPIRMWRKVRRNWLAERAKNSKPGSPRDPV